LNARHNRCCGAVVAVDNHYAIAVVHNADRREGDAPRHGGGILPDLPRVDLVRA
jgi:hypothetical protein